MSPFDGITALLHKTPQEHLNGMWKIVRKLPQNSPPRHIRVHLYVGWKPGCDETEFVMRHSALVADFPLERSGRLDLGRVRSKWGLRGCAPIDPCRRTKFSTADPGYVSPLAIRVLSESEGILKLFEPTPSKGTIVMRDLRLRIVTALDNMWLQLPELLVNTIYLVATLFFLAMLVLGVPTVLGWYVLGPQQWLKYVPVMVSP